MCFFYYLLAGSRDKDGSLLSGPSIQGAPDTIVRRTANAGKVAVGRSRTVVLDGLSGYIDTNYKLAFITPNFRRMTYLSSLCSVMVKVHCASVNAPDGVGLSLKLTVSLQGQAAVEISWYFQLAEHCTSDDGSVSVKSRVVLNLRSSGHVFPGMPVSLPIRCTFMVGMDHDSVVRVARRGIERAGRASERESSAD